MLKGIQGPQGVWDDRWSTRWNPNVFAHQGYFVVAVNPTGSTTFGQGECSCHARAGVLLTLLSIDLVDAIAKDWGGKPFVDLQKGWKYALDKYPEIDPDRAVAAGASWGGAVYNGYSTDELFFVSDHIIYLLCGWSVSITFEHSSTTNGAADLGTRMRKNCSNGSTR